MTKPRVPEITPDELLQALEKGRDMQVLDVRAPHRLASGHIDQVPRSQFFYVAGSQVLALDDPATTGIDPERPLAVVCGHGNSSQRVTSFLAAQGFQARSLRGGMAAWMNALFPRALPAPASLSALIQFDRVGKGALAYLLVSRGEALVVDPPRHFQSILDRAESLDARIVGVADTHVHADFISGAPELASNCGVPYYLHPSDHVYPYDNTPGRLAITPLADAFEISFGEATVRTAHTPGHTEGSVTFLLGAAAALTGDFVFVGSVGRPDLGGRSGEWTEHLWRSLERARAEWPDDLRIYPAHYASDRERASDRTVGATFAQVRRNNAPLAIDSAERFSTWVAERQSEFPESYRKIKAINVGLLDVSEEEAEELEVGKNECAVG